MTGSALPTSGEPPRLPPGVPGSYPYPRVPVTRLLDDAAKDFPETVAVDVAGHRLTYRQVVDQVDRLATALRGLGLEPGDRVGLLLPHSPQHLIALFATLRAGATAVLVDPAVPDLEDAVNAPRCRVLVCSSSAYPRLAALKGLLPSVRHILATGPEDYLPFPRNIAYPLVGRRDGSYHRIGRGEKVAGFKDLIRRTAPEPIAVGMDAPAVILDRMTFRHDALLAGAFQLRLWVPDVQAGRERLLCAVAASTPLGLVGVLGLGVLAAATIHYPSRPGQALASAVRRAAPTLMVADPAAFAGLAGDTGILGSLRVGLADGPVDQQAADAIHGAVGARVRGGLSVAGAPGLVHANPVYGRGKPGSVGLAVPDTRTAVLADDGTPLAPGEVGTIAVQGPQTTCGVWGDPGATAALRSGPWLRTEQRGHLDADGYLWLDRGA